MATAGTGGYLEQKDTEGLGGTLTKDEMDYCFQVCLDVGRSSATRLLLIRLRRCGRQLCNLTCIRSACHTI